MSAMTVEAERGEGVEVKGWGVEDVGKVQVRSGRELGFGVRHNVRRCSLRGWSSEVTFRLNIFANLIVALISFPCHSEGAGSLDSSGQSSYCPSYEVIHVTDAGE